jgi:hypothetical protein
MKIAVTTPDARTADQAWQAIVRHGGFTEVKITCEDNGHVTHLHCDDAGHWTALAGGIMLRF